MNAQAGFADDFEEFRRHGEIGAVASLRLVPSDPAPGALITVTAVNIVDGRLRTADGRSWQIGGDQSVELRVDAALSLYLTDAHGLVLQHVHVQPRFVRPSLVAWALPEQVTASEPRWTVPAPLTESCVTVDEDWCFAGAAWQPLPPDRTIVLPPTGGSLRLRATLRSQHARLSPAGTLDVERIVRCHAASARLIAHNVPDAVPCRETTWLSASVRHARRAWLSIDGETVAELEGGAWEDLGLVHRFTPERCTSRLLRLHATDWGGRTAELLCMPLEVQPRPVRISTRPSPDDARYTRLEVQGGQPIYLELPAYGARIALSSQTTDIVNLGDAATLSLVAVQNDVGDIQVHELVIAQRSFSWHPLPELSELPRFSI